LSFAFPLALSAVASAEAVCGDVDCPANWECKTEEQPCASTACDKGDCGAIPECTPSTYSYCSPLPCTDDSQCDAGMLCYSETHEECDSAPPCDGSGDCPTIEPTCSNVTVSACVPPYVAPCEVDDDCGTGFTCELEEDCVCSTSGSSGGSAGSAGASGTGGTSGSGEKAAPDAGAEPAPPADGSGATPDAGAPDDPSCICSKGERKTCNMKVVTCSVDEGCPSGWTCGDNPDRACWASSDGSSGCEGPEKVCLPPWSDVIHGARGGSSEDTGGLATDPKGNVDGSGSGGTSGETPPTDSAAGGSSNAAPGANAESDPNSSGSEESGGCSIARAPNAWNATFGFAALALAGLFGARRRRTH
jgi:MYXO-CTERM domain-containing protein